MDAIVNVCEGWAIGQGEQLLVRLPSDLRCFRRRTEGKTVILGRKTLETFPGKRPLRARRNLILSRSLCTDAENATVLRSLPALLACVRALPPDEVFVVGGAEIYRLLLPYCRRAFVTRTCLALPADRFFPDLDALPNWSARAVSEQQEENGVRFCFAEYENAAPLPLP